MWTWHRNVFFPFGRQKLEVVVSSNWQPYADGTSGHQGEASEDSEPKRRGNIPVALTLVKQKGPLGLTWKELGDLTGWHHGQASGALSNLHRTGDLTRLKQRRNGCGIYVVPAYVNGRDEVPHRSNRRTP